LAGGAHEAKFSPDGRTLAFGNVSLQLWDWRADKKVREIPLPARAGVGTLAFSLDSQTVATGGWDNVVRLWDVRTAKQRGVLAVAHQLHQAAFSPCGRFVAALDRQGSVRIWEIAAQKDRVVIDVERTALQAMAISPDGRWLALGGSDRAIYVFDLYTAEEVHQFHGHASYVTSLAFSPSGEFLASGAADSTALVWDARLFSQIRLRKPIKLTTKELESHVRDLGSDEGEKVFKAIHQLVVGGDPSVAFLRIAQSPVTKDDLARIPILLRDLDSEVLAVRNQAAKQLELLGEQAVPALEALRDKGPSPELLRRADAVLAKIRVIGPDTLRALRTVEVLEKIATPAAREVLRSLREGAPGVRLTEEARVALQRLEKNAK
jgi:hypothetical protein